MDEWSARPSSAGASGIKGASIPSRAFHRADNGSEDRYESLIRPALLPEGKVKGLTVPAEELEDAPRHPGGCGKRCGGWLTHSLVLVDGNSLALFARDLESSGAYLPAFFYLNLKAPEKDSRGGGGEPPRPVGNP